MNPIRKRRGTKDNEDLNPGDELYDMEEHIDILMDVKPRSTNTWSRRTSTMRSFKIPVLFAALTILILFIFIPKIAVNQKQKMAFHDPLRSNLDLNEFIDARSNLLEAKAKGTAPLGHLDMQKYTVRINTWRRNDILLISVRHFRSCPNVAQVQIVWCDGENEPPQELIRMEDDHDIELASVVIEKHLVNTLNERFHIMHNTPTLGILSVDDDVLRPCSALDVGFHLWKMHPDRMVGYDYRSHSEVVATSTNSNHEINLHPNLKWNYMLKTPTWKSNYYSITLTRFCFLHKDYLDLYMDHAPRRVLESVDVHMNCEDIAMSFFVSALTNGKAPLLVDHWAINTLVKLKSSKKISKGLTHLDLRNECVDLFGFLMGLKDGYTSIQRYKDTDWSPLVHGKIRLNDKRFSTSSNDEAPSQKVMGDFFRLKKKIQRLGMFDSEPG